MARITRGPWFTGNHVSLLHVGGHITWRKSILHSKRIEEWLDSRSHLPTSVHHPVVSEMLKIQSANISFHMSVFRIHTHKSRSQERFQIADRIKWSHQSIHLTMIGKD